VSRLRRAMAIARVNICFLMFLRSQVYRMWFCGYKKVCMFLLEDCSMRSLQSWLEGAELSPFGLGLERNSMGD
jgi:hypothetical protein